MRLLAKRDVSIEKCLNTSTIQHFSIVISEIMRIFAQKLNYYDKKISRPEGGSDLQESVW